MEKMEIKQKVYEYKLKHPYLIKYSSYQKIKDLREKMPNTFFLIPGYGAQGGKAEDIALAFDKNGVGGIVNASRSLMAAYKSEMWRGKPFQEATRLEALRMRDELNNSI